MASSGEWAPSATCRRVGCISCRRSKHRERKPPILTPRDINVSRAEGVVRIQWADGRSQAIGIPILRRQCRCAQCVDEMTGRRILDPASVPDDLTISDMSLVGNYAIQFVFSDGHDTGLYTWDVLATMPETRP